MSKKNKKKSPETTIENYYDIRKEAVDDLVSALKGEETESAEPSMNMADYAQSEEEKKKLKDKQFNPYSVDKMSRIPTWIKAIFVKFWAAGAVCFFITWGLQSFLNNENLVLLMGLVMGIVTDVFVNSAFIHFQSDAREYDAYMLLPFPFKVFWTFFVNIAYSIGVMFVVSFIYAGINIYFDTVFGVEPLLFGVFYTAVDMVFIGIKDLIVFLVRKAKKKKREASLDV
jgi:hypothetical protein